MSTKFIKGALAAALAAVFGVALAQGNPPNANVTNPAVGAGQQSSQATPMGTTGTPAGGSTATRGSTTTGAGTSMGAGTTGSTPTASAGSDTGKTMKASGGKSKKKARKAKRDRG
ncbi:proteophosphoglycan ppg4 [Ramlibacter albus]|uniref:Proteophosphoglycan ppg4 n=1 Tax=Ramlibacter albus TaxID=2079448 RepID=A0A923S4Z3_9BURK|nr:proteophosphoglycan ppg4 [Ramlibacter albus]MBC5767393.1 proteophosphoglycan ppg4 [Ramlibacter albus]